MAKILIFGGNGFVGRYIIKELAASNHIIKIFSRNQATVNELKVCGDVGQIVSVIGSVLNEQLIKKHTLGMDIVINLVGLLYENCSQEFDLVHNIAAQNIAKYAKMAQVEQLIHFSALGIENNPKYNKSKLKGENAVKAEFPNSVIIRPSIIFGEEDSFFNKFARIASFFPFLPLIGDGKSIMQPVYVNDIAHLVHKVIEKKIVSITYEVAGPKRYSFKELMEFILSNINRERIILKIPFSIAKVIAWIIEFRIVSLLLKPVTGSSAPILTQDQVDLLRYDNVSDNRTLESMGITPQTIEEIVPHYLQKYRKQN